jgi:hypothetical protein
MEGMPAGVAQRIGRASTRGFIPTTSSMTRAEQRRPALPFAAAQQEKTSPDFWHKTCN